MSEEVTRQLESLRYVHKHVYAHIHTCTFAVTCTCIRKESLAVLTCTVCIMYRALHAELRRKS